MKRLRREYLENDKDENEPGDHLRDVGVSVPESWAANATMLSVRKWPSQELWRVWLHLTNLNLFKRDPVTLTEHDLMRIYFAGPLFTQAERSWNELVARELGNAGFEVFLPQTEVKAIPTLNADAIFQVDVDGVRSADVIVAVLDGADPDSGTCFECGLAYALGIPIVAVRTDFRAGGDALPGQKLATINLMLSQAASEIVNLPDPATTFDAFVERLTETLKDLKASPKPVERLRE